MKKTNFSAYICDKAPKEPGECLDRGLEDLPQERHID